MTPSEREKLDLEIYLETKKPQYRGCISDAADFLRMRDPSRISRLINPTDTRASNIFGLVLDVLQGINHKHPDLARFIWAKMSLAKDSFMDAGEERVRLAELAAIADTAAREQLDVNLAISTRRPVGEIKQEAFEAYEKSRIQYEKASALTNADSGGEQL
jgi:hypothetical protein